MKHIATMKYIDVMKRVVTIKYQKWLVSALTLLLTWFGVPEMYSSRYFRAGDKIYIDVRQDKWDGGFDWSNDGANILMHLWGSGVNEWVHMNYKEYEHNDHKINTGIPCNYAKISLPLTRIARNGSAVHATVQDLDVQ